jgi:xanthine dehydrogenase molybdopterin-binding subunit B
MQGGVAQGIGWALNEEYIYNKNGKVDNAGFLDYRMPVCLGPADDRHRSWSRCRIQNIRRASRASARCRWCR